MKYTCEKFSIISSEKENNLKNFIIKIDSFFEDKEKLKNDLTNILGNICETIEINENNEINFILY